MSQQATRERSPARPRLVLPVTPGSFDHYPGIGARTELNPQIETIVTLDDPGDRTEILGENRFRGGAPPDVQILSTGKCIVQRRVGEQARQRAGNPFWIQTSLTTDIAVDMIGCIGQ